VMYENEKNSSRIFEIYERLFELKKKDRSVPEFYGELKSLVDELEMHKPAATLREYRQGVAVSKFLFGLSPTVQSQMRGRYWEIIFPH